MDDTTRREGRSGDETRFIMPNGFFLGVSETDILALEREARPKTTSRRRPDDPARTEPRA